jgi:hypothetical protein
MKLSWVLNALLNVQMRLCWKKKLVPLPFERHSVKSIRQLTRKKSKYAAA